MQLEWLPNEDRQARYHEQRTVVFALGDWPGRFPWREPVAFGEKEIVYFVDGFLGAVSHAQARGILKNAFRTLFGREGTLPELQIAQAISLGESNYGNAGYRNRVTGEVVRNTNNWTAQQCSQRPPCPSTCFEATDTHANGDPYQACFRLFPTPEAGAADFLRILYKSRPQVLEAASRGDYLAVSERMRSSGYFELGLADHQKALNANIDRVAQALGEPRADTGASKLLQGKSRWLLWGTAAGLIAAGITFPSWRKGVGL